MSTTLPARRRTSTRNRPAASSPPPIWHASAPAEVIRAASWDDQSPGWSAWVDHLKHRKLPPAAELFDDRAPLAWGLSAGDPTLDLIGRLRKPGKNEVAQGEWQQTLSQWLAETRGSFHDAQYALESLAWAYALPRLARLVSAGLWWETLDHLCAAASEAAQGNPQHNPWPQQALGSELALVLAYHFPEIQRCRDLVESAQRCLTDGFDKLLGGEGCLTARHLPLVRPLLACWTRSWVLSKQLDDVQWPGTLQQEYAQFVLGALRMTRRDGSATLSIERSNPQDKALFAAAIEQADDESLRRIAPQLAPGQKPPARPSKKKNQPAPPSTGCQSDRAEIGVLRSGWSRVDSLLSVTYSDLSVATELHVAGETLWSGTWELDVRFNGAPMPIDSPWENVCWVSDEDADYLELEAQLRGGLRVQRHLMLARKEGFAFLADSVLGAEPGKIEYRSRLPLAAGIECSPAAETRELLLTAGNRRATLLPLALPEWRCDPRGGTLSRADEGLELRQSADCLRLFAPLWIDLDPRRAGKPLTWRQVTVAQERQIQSGDVAVGYRVQVARQQWLIYRSLGPRGNRTLLGSNLVSEFMIARFDAEGEVHPLVEIE